MRQLVGYGAFTGTGVKEKGLCFHAKYSNAFSHVPRCTLTAISTDVTLGTKQAAEALATMYNQTHKQKLEFTIKRVIITMEDVKDDNNID